MWTLIYGWHVLPFELLAGTAVLATWSTAARSLITKAPFPINDQYEQDAQECVVLFLAWAIGTTVILGIIPLIIGAGWEASERGAVIAIAVILLLGSPLFGAVVGIIGASIVAWCYWAVGYEPAKGLV